MAVCQVSWLGPLDAERNAPDAGSITDTNMIRLVLFSMQNRTFGPYLAAIVSILISVLKGPRDEVFCHMIARGFLGFVPHRGLIVLPSLSYSHASGSFCWRPLARPSLVLLTFVPLGQE
jgi:hypothetical protein